MGIIIPTCCKVVVMITLDNIPKALSILEHSKYLTHLFIIVVGTLSGRQ